MQVTAFDVNATDDMGGQLVVTGANNLIRSHNLSPSVVVSSDDPLLGAIANNGGPTQTHALLTGSPAIDHGSNPLNLTTDQRGSSFIRVVGGAADIGAFELQTAAPPELPGDYNGDRSVNAADYVVWCNTQGTEVPRYTGADGNGDGKIDNADYDVWRSHFGATLAAAAPTSTSTGGAANIEIATQPSDAAIDVRSDSPMPPSSMSASLGSYAAYFTYTATGNDTGNGTSLRVKRTLPVVTREAHDLALLAVVAQRSDGPKSFAAATEWNEEFETGAARSDSNDSLRQLNCAAIRSLLQTATPAAASNGTA